MFTRDLLEHIPAANYENYDLKNPNLRTYLNELTKLCWTLVSTPLEDRPDWFDAVHLAPFIAKREHPEAWARTYEVAGLACISYLASRVDSSKLALLDDFVGGLVRELHEGSSPARSNLFLQAICHYKQGDRGAGLLSFQQGNSQHVPSGVVTPFFSYSRSAVCGVLNYPELLSLMGDDTGGPKLSEPNIKPNGSRVVLTTGNPAYVETYFPTFLESFLSFDDTSNVDLHLHIMKEPDDAALPEAVEAVISAAKKQLGPRFGCSFSDSPRLRDMRSYFASARFFLMDAFIEAYELVVVTDIDMKTIKPVSGTFHWAEEYDLGFPTPREQIGKSWIPWLKTMAGTVSVKSSKQTREFWSHFAPIYRWVTSANDYNWGVDQNILTEMLDAFGPGLALGNIDLLRPFVPPGIARPNPK